MPEQIVTNLNEHPADGTNVAAAVAAGMQIPGAQPIGSSDRFFTQLIPANASAQVIDVVELEDALALYPRRKKGTVHVQDADSFIAYIAKHGLAETEVFADPARKALVGVINAHQESEDYEGTAGHGDHRVVLELIETDSWKAWLARDKKWHSQLEFAEHLEDNANDVVDPDPATMLEIAQSFHASTSADFKRAERLTNGLVQLRYEETQTARAGQAGDLDIPTVFALSISPFEGSPPHEITARFRYRISNGNLTLSYALLNPGDVTRAAFLTITDTVADTITQPVFQGRPA